MSIERLIKMSMFILIITISSCTSTSELPSNKRMKFSVQGGVNIGGIVENTDMSLVPNVVVPPEASVDAFTGATRTGANIGLRVNQPLRRNELETGIDFMFNSQEFNYIDAGNHYIGVRQLNVSQFMIPLTYNFILYRKADVELKLGYVGQMNFVTSKAVGILPEYSINKWSGGPTIGISACPVIFANGSKLGIYFDLYRGSRIYSDFYNQASFEMPGSSFMKFGIKYQLK